MKHSLGLAFVFSCIITVLFSCGKENEVEKSEAYLEGVYQIQELESRFHYSENGVSQVWYYDYEKKILMINGKVAETTSIPFIEDIIPGALADAFYKYFVQNYVLFPNSIVFQKDGTISLAVFDKYIDDVLPFFSGKYDLESGTVSLSFVGIETARYRVVSNSVNGLQLELSKEFLAEINQMNSEEGKSEYTIFEGSTASFKKVAEVSPFNAQE